MNQVPKLTNFSISKLTLLYILSSTTLLIFISASLLSNSWVHTNYPKSFKFSSNKSRDLNLSQFSGGLEYCASGCSNSDVYLDLKSKYCDSPNNYLKSESESICKMFTNLLISGLIKKVFDILTLIVLVFILTFQIISIKYQRFSKCWTGLMVFSCITYIIGTAAWLTLNDFKVSSCKEFPKNGNVPCLCMSIFTYVSIAVSCTLLSSVMVFVVLRKRWREEGEKTQTVVTNLSYQIQEIFPKDIEKEGESDSKEVFKDKDGDGNQIELLGECNCDRENEDNEYKGCELPGGDINLLKTSADDRVGN